MPCPLTLWRLYCNLDRAEARRAYAACRGVQMALCGKVPRDVLEATTNTPEEAEDRDYEQRKHRRTAAALAGRILG